MNRVLEVVLLVLEIRLEVFLKPFDNRIAPKALFCCSFSHRSDWGFTTTSGQNRSVTGGSRNVITHIPVAKLVPVS